MRAFVHIVPIFLIIALFAGCSKEKNDCLKSTGTIVLEDRVVLDFTQIEVYNNVNVVITQDTFSSVTIEAGTNLIDKVTTVVQGDSLVIRNENKCNWVRSFKYDITAYVTVKKLLKIEQRGYGEISGTNTIQTSDLIITILGNGDVELTINANSCFSDMHTSGDLILKGYANVNGIWSSGNNWIRCQELQTNITFVESRTSGDCLVNVSDSLAAKIFSVGGVRYSGDPEKISSVIEGTGKLIKE